MRSFYSLSLAAFCLAISISVAHAQTPESTAPAAESPAANGAIVEEGAQARLSLQTQLSSKLN
jgi:hypothetical protein